MSAIRPIILRAAAIIAAMLVQFLIVQPAAAQCTSDCITKGEKNTPIPFEGIQRSFILHVPNSYTGQLPVPLLIDLHGYANTATNERNWSGQVAQSDKRGFIAVFPQGLDNSWNAYGCCGNSLVRNVHDVAFLRAVIEWVKQHGYVDPARVYVTGLSTGGSMAHRMACEAADVVTAVATVSFPLNRASCTPSRPITLYSIAGTGDWTVPYAGLGNTDNGYANSSGRPQAYQSALGSLAAWKRNDRCTDDASSRPIASKVTEVAYRSCASGVRTALLTIQDAPHILYKANYLFAPIDVSEYIWNEAFK